MAALSCAATAEGRKDPFLKCGFEDGREVVLAEDGEGTAWVEGGTRYPAVNYADKREGHDPIVSVVAYLPWRTMKLDIFVPDPDWDERLPLPPLSALLSETVMLQAGMLVESVTGSCEEVGG